MGLSWGDGCFVCGKGNAAGLQLDFQVDPHARTIATWWVPSASFQGYDGILHGGIIATLLDECVGRLALDLGCPGVTVDLSVRYLKPVPIGEDLEVRAHLPDSSRRLMVGEAEALLADRSIAARATVKLMKDPT